MKFIQHTSKLAYIIGAYPRVFMSSVKAPKFRQKLRYRAYTGHPRIFSDPLSNPF